jgi:hypothetical protein
MMMAAATIAAVTLSGCVKLWEEELTAIQPLPAVEVPVTPDQWERGNENEEPVLQ